jgi:hypothetical protein
MNKLPGVALSLVTAFFSPAAFAQDNTNQKNPADLNFKIQAGTEYDSTLTVVELDQTSDKGDWAAVLNGRVGVELKPTERISLKGSYSFASHNYREYSAFDQDLHIVSLDAGIDLAGITWGVSHHFAHAKLASKPLLDLSKTSFYAGKLFSNGVYLRGAFTESDKRFDTNSERNTDGTEMAGDMYYFFNGARTFWSVGASQETEDARSPAFDNDALKLRARFSHTGELAGHKSQVQLGWRYENRDYGKEESLPGTGNPGTGNDLSPFGANPQYIGTNTRQDRSQIVEASWALNLFQPLTLETKIEHGNYSSNFEAADYKETGVSVLMSLEF